MSDPLAPLRRLLSITDPVKRAKEIGHVLADIPKLTPELRASRQAAVRQMREDRGMSYGDVAKELGVSRGRAQQIAEGRTTGKRADPPEETTAT